jgi:hypothetical protein
MNYKVTIFLFYLIIVFEFACKNATKSEKPDKNGYLPGLKATYSTSVDKIEAPIFHGWWSECDSTGNNLYEGQCTAVAECPVNWAWGNFSASWEGYIYIPENGEYRFNSHYWVDGIIYIAINDTVIANLDTPGGGYSKSMTLSGKTWYPLSMTFASNRGSNNMHLGWNKPGGDWEIVPAEDLGHR